MADCAAKRRHTFGARNHSAKLTEAQVIEIRTAYVKTGIRKGNGRVLAKKYGVAPGTITEIVSGKRWKYLQRDEVRESK